MTHPNKPRTIRLKEDMKSCVTQGEKNIPAGTIMEEYAQQLTWAYFRDKHNNTLIIMGHSSADWDKVELIHNHQ
jgi:hypothetical protein